MNKYKKPGELLITFIAWIFAIVIFGLAIFSIIPYDQAAAIIALMAVNILGIQT